MVGPSLVSVGLEVVFEVFFFLEMMVNIFVRQFLSALLIISNPFPLIKRQLVGRQSSKHFPTPLPVLGPAFRTEDTKEEVEGWRGGSKIRSCEILS